jgi:outer membrane protein W
VKLILAILVLLAAAPAYAQLDVRPFVQLTAERYRASTTFNAVFETNTVPAWGAGVAFVVRRRVFVDVAVSRMSKSGQRAFVSNGEAFRLAIPLRVTSTPVEISGGYRFGSRRSRVVPYVGLGVGSYSYRETSDFSAPGEDVDARHAGVLVLGGVEFRLSRWVGISGDAQYTRVPGILGQAGISKDLNENDLGGLAGRLRVILGR